MIRNYSISNDRGIKIIKVNDKYQLVTKNENSNYIQKLLKKNSRQSLSQAALELSLIHILASVQVKFLNDSFKEKLEIKSTVEVAPKPVVEKSKQATANKVVKKEEKKSNQHKKVHQSVRVDLERLDNFMNMVSELVINRKR